MLLLSFNYRDKCNMDDPFRLEKLKAKNRNLVTKLQKLLLRVRELLDNQQQIDALFNNAPVELYLKDKEGRYLKINKQFEKIFGVKNSDLIGKLPTDIHNPELAKATRILDLAVLSSGEIQHREDKVLLVTDDRIHTLSTIKFPVFDDTGAVNGLGAIVTDITEQRQVEDRFRNIVDTIDGIVWEYDINSDQFTYVSPQAERLLGYSDEDWKTAGFWLRTMHTDDRLTVADYCSQCVEAGQDKYETEYRAIAKDGHIVRVRFRVSVVKEDGSPRWLRGLMIDITERKEKEEAAKAIDNRFRTMFISAPVGMLLIDLKTTNLLEINPAYTKIVGRSVTEIKKLGWQKMTHPDDLAENTQNLKWLQEGKINRFKMLKRFIKPDDSVVWVELTVNVIENQSGPVNSQYLAVFEDVTTRKNFEEKIWSQANFDFLTGLPNRSMFQDRLSQAINRSHRDDKDFAILLIDLDQFKDVNDTLGHNRGDELLIDAASRIKLCVRESDTVARLGGDEFIIILSELSYLASVGTVAQKIIGMLAKPFNLGQNTAYISASIGITLYPKDGSESVNLIKNADQAMYAAKKNGRNCYHFFTPLMQQLTEQRIALVYDLRNAIKNEEFILYYQPIVELDSNQIFKAEALIRWLQPDRGLISPIDFIPVAEETRMITEIGNWVFLEAAKQSKRWQTTFRKDFQISVNTSPIQFENAIDFPWKKHLTKLNLSGSSIGIEITESLLMTSDQSALNTLLEFRDAGIQVSLDDFGTGYSSLSYLRKFDIDYLKIDQSFVQNLEHGSDDLALCSAIIVMAHKLGIKVVAEGIETQLQKDLLKSINCDFGQGYLFSKPVPADEFEKLMSKR
jgi:diguanylate cyclase (GGDEF)-like protein/PAS domain S-box-containing protein